jgi:hypothetical protein
MFTRVAILKWTLTVNAAEISVGFHYLVFITISLGLSIKCNRQIHHVGQETKQREETFILSIICNLVALHHVRKIPSKTTKSEHKGFFF